MPQPTHTSCRPFATLLLALCLVWARSARSSSPTAQALYRPASAAPLPIQILWNNGAPWSWDGARLTLRAESGVGLVPPQEAPGSRAPRGLGLSADAPCLKGCTADVLRLALPAPVDAGPYLAKGHLQFEVERSQAISGTLLVWYGGTAACGKASVPLASVKLGAYTHVSLPLADFSACPVKGRMTVPFGLGLKQARYNAGPMLAFKFIRWTPD